MASKYYTTLLETRGVDTWYDCFGRKLRTECLRDAAASGMSLRDWVFDATYDAYDRGLLVDPDGEPVPQAEVVAELYADLTDDS
jgi:hypothetical protein